LDKAQAAARSGPLVGMHLRSGFADWQWYSSTMQVATSASKKTMANGQWRAALRAAPLDYVSHWRTFESMLHDCTETGTMPPFTPRPCFNWRSPYHRSPSVHDAEGCALGRLATISQRGLPLPAGLEPAAPPSRSSDHQLRTCLKTGSGTCLRSLATPGNGTLTASVECAHRFAVSLAKPPTAGAAGSPLPHTSSGGDGSAWGLFVLGDAPGYMSLIHALPDLRGRVVHTNDAGGVAHTTFTGSCPRNSASCEAKGTVDPQGGWTRAMIDFYVGGLTDAFVSTLFSSFVGALLRRSLVCCKERMHYGAMYSQQHSHRDKPMRHVDFLRALMQTEEQGTEVDAWQQRAH
jgi:hypothetical protein